MRNQHQESSPPEKPRGRELACATELHAEAHAAGTSCRPEDEPAVAPSDSASGRSCTCTGRLREISTRECERKR
nr:unnamed protein product [Digitaria exilis]